MAEGLEVLGGLGSFAVTVGFFDVGVATRAAAGDLVLLLPTATGGGVAEVMLTLREFAAAFSSRHAESSGLHCSADDGEAVASLDCATAAL